MFGFKKITINKMNNEKILVDLSKLNVSKNIAKKTIINPKMDAFFLIFNIFNILYTSIIFYLILKG